MFIPSYCSFTELKFVSKCSILNGWRHTLLPQEFSLGHTDTEKKQVIYPRKKEVISELQRFSPVLSNIFIIVRLDCALDYYLVDYWCVLLPPSKEICRMGFPLCQFMKHPHSLRNLIFIMLIYLVFCLDSTPIRSIRKNN